MVCVGLDVAIRSRRSEDLQLIKLTKYTIFLTRNCPWSWCTIDNLEEFGRKGSLMLREYLQVLALLGTREGM